MKKVDKDKFLTPSEEQETKTRTGMCKFCKQYNVVRWIGKEEPTEEDLIELGTDACKCEDSKWYSERKYKIAAAEERIEDMLKNPEEHTAKEILINAASKIVDGNIYSISINIGNGVKVDMKHGNENAVKIKRQEVETREETV